MSKFIFLKSFMINFFAMFLAAAVFIIGMPYNVEGTEKEIAVIGSSRIYDNITSARNAAVAEGLLSAVESVALEMIPRENLRSRFETISAELYGKRLDLTQGYQVLKEVNTGKYYRVLIQTTVSVDKIQTMLKDLGITMPPEALPKTLFLVAEKHADDLSFYYWWHSGTTTPTFEKNAALKTIKQIFRKQGFPIIDHRALFKNEILSDLTVSADLTTTEAITIGQRGGADVVVFGKAIATETPNKMGKDIRTFRGSISLTAVNINTETIIDSTNQTETAASREVRDGSHNALANAGYQAGRILAEKIFTAWSEQAQQTGTLEIRVKGEENILPQLVNFRKALRDMDGITALQTTERSQSNALLSVKYEGSARGLADKILVTPFEDFGVNIYDMTENVINIELLTDPSITESDIN